MLLGIRQDAPPWELQILPPFHNQASKNLSALCFQSWGLFSLQLAPRHSDHPHSHFETLVGPSHNKS